MPKGDPQKRFFLPAGELKAFELFCRGKGLMKSIYMGLASGVNFDYNGVTMSIIWNKAHGNWTVDRRLATLLAEFESQK